MIGMSAAVITRRPVFAQDLAVQAYELCGGTGTESGETPDRSAARVLVQGVLTHGLHALTGGKPAYLRVTRELLVRGHVSLLPSGAVTLLLGQDVTADPATVNTLGELSAQGHRFALAGCTADDGRLPLLDVVDAATVDFRALAGSARRDAVRAVLRGGVPLIAERVDTYDGFVEAFDLGCAAAQGAFFAAPTPMEGRLAPGFKPIHVQLLQVAQRPELDFEELERLVKQDFQLSHQFLRYVNAAAFGWRRPVDSLHQAFVLLGEDIVRKWISLLLLADLAADRPEQLAVTASVRARFCELLGATAGVGASGLDLFLVGMFSLIDAVLGRPMSAAVGGLPLADNVKAALMGQDNPLRTVLDAVIAYENGDWDELGVLLERLGVPDDRLLEFYLTAVDWAAAAFDAPGGE